ncbi:MAG: lasso peptide biosynthesis PqqD family chaperone [Oscillochloris sp.]|nr:lasso peptide biosynthesis PqqD family chaperone [Oscillochloris sp.]
MITLGSSVVVSADQIASDLAGEAVILNLKNGIYYGLDQVGARIWSLIQAPCSPQAISAVLIEEYDVAPEQCRQDVLDLLQHLAGEGLIEVRDAATA